MNSTGGKLDAMGAGLACKPDSDWSLTRFTFALR
jgi:hypothetical protein